MVCKYNCRRIQRPLADRIIFQGGKTESENKTVLREFTERGADTNMDSVNSVPAFLFVKVPNEERGTLVYQFHIGNTDYAVSKNKFSWVAHRSLSPVEEAGQNLFWPAGVCMVNHGIILDTNDEKYH
jgi:hypothetical protein